MVIMTSPTQVKLPEIDDFDIIKPISRGAFGHVYLAKKKDKSDTFYAIKTMKKNDLVNKNMIEQVVAERDALAISKSPYIVHLFYSFQSKNQIFLVMEYLIGGDVKSLLHNLGYFDEHMSKIYTAQVVLALEYLHSHGIIHRDLKPDNMLVSNEGYIKLTDFGLSQLDLERNKKPTIVDIMNTPSCKWPLASSNYWRTPGQIASLTTDFTFSVPKAVKPKVRSLSRILSEERVEPMEESYKFTSPVSVSKSHRRLSSSRRRTSMESPDRHNRSLLATPLNPSIAHAKSGKRGRKREMDGWRPNLREFSDGGSSPEKRISSEDEHDDRSPKRRRVSHTGLTCVLDHVAIDHDDNGRSLHVAKDDAVFVSPLPSNYDMHNCSENGDHFPESDNIDTKVSPCGDGGLNGNIGVQNDTVYESCSEKFPATPGPPRTTRAPRDHYDVNCSLEDYETCNGTFPTINSRSTRPTQDSYDCNTSLEEYQTCDETFSTSTVPRSTIPSRDSRKSPEYPNAPVNLFVTPSKNTERYTHEQRVGSHASEHVTKIEREKIFQTPVANAPRHFRTASVTKIRFQSPMETAYEIHPRIAKTSPRVRAQPFTPLRTPKSCKRGAPEKPPQRILGTPDYLAPEILLKLDHGVGVDWWALGVCLYEFLTGVPPFNDDTPELVFKHILDVEYLLPEGDETLSDDAEGAINTILIKDLTKRPGAKDIKCLPFFSSLDWSNISQYPAPFVPNPDDETDTTYFEARNTIQNLQLSSFHN